MIIIGYARVSTTNQLGWYTTQIQQLQKYKKVDVKLSEILSVRSGMSSMLKNTIIDQFNIDNDRVGVYVCSIDRLTKNVYDMGFICKYIKSIYIISQSNEDEVNTTINRYDIDTDIKSILDIIKHGRSEYNNCINVANTIQTRTMTTNKLYVEKINNANYRVGKVLSSLIIHHVDVIMLNNFINISQNLNHNYDWYLMSSYSLQLGGLSIMNDYVNSIDNNIPSKLSRSEVLYYVLQMTKKNRNVKFEVIKEFVNAILHLLLQNR